MKQLSLYILIAFIAIGVFGFTGLTTTDSLFSKCVEATIPGGICELHLGVIPFIQSQIYLGFSLGLIAALIVFLATLVMLGALNFFQEQQWQLSVAPSLYIIDNKHSRWDILHQQHPGH